MESPVLELERILKREIDLYDRIAEIEVEKTDAILSRNGREIEQFSNEQETILSEIAVLERRREDSIESYKAAYGYDGVASVTLESVIHNMDEDSALRLSRCGMELKKTVLRIQSLSDTNRKLIEDNLEFFSMLISGIKNSVSIHAGYTREGASSQTMKGALLINRTV
jgi:flagellar biosynthesis/type III secretory pathway chaperone